MIEENTVDNSLWDSGVHLLMEDFSFGSCQTAIEFILEHNYKHDKHKELTLMICSYGGDLAPTFALIDVIRGSSIPIKTIGLGVIASCGLLTFITGYKRILTNNTSILSHQFCWGSFGKEHELFATMREFELTSNRMIEHYKKCTKLSEEQIRTYLLPPQDVWLSSEDAFKLNLCDEVKEV